MGLINSILSDLNKIPKFNGSSFAYEQKTDIDQTQLNGNAKSKKKGKLSKKDKKAAKQAKYAQKQKLKEQKRIQQQKAQEKNRLKRLQKKGDKRVILKKPTLKNGKKCMNIWWIYIDM